MVDFLEEEIHILAFREATGRADPLSGNCYDLDGDRMYTEKWYEDPDYRTG